MKQRKDLAKIGVQMDLFCQEVSPVRTFQTRKGGEMDNRALEGNEQDFCMICSGLSENSDRNTSSLKMFPNFSQLTMVEILQKSRMNWSQWGTISNGVYAERQRSVRPIIGPGCSFLLTPMASDCKRVNLSLPVFTRRYHRSAGSLPEQLHRAGYNGQISPMFLSWAMSFPENWLISPFQNGCKTQ